MSQFEERVKKRFPPGMPEEVFLREVAALGFTVPASRLKMDAFCSSPRCATYVQWDRKELLGYSWNIEWTVDGASRIKAVQATGAILN